jgi:hypothetical protein
VSHTAAANAIERRPISRTRSVINQLEGLRGIALVELEHDAFTAVRQKLPANVLLLLAGD